MKTNAPKKGTKIEIQKIALKKGDRGNGVQLSLLQAKLLQLSELNFVFAWNYLP